MSPELQASLFVLLVGLIGWLLRQTYTTKSEIAGILAEIRADMGKGDQKLTRLADALNGYDGQGGILSEQRRQATQLGELTTQLGQLAFQANPPAKPRRPR